MSVRSARWLRHSSGRCHRLTATLHLTLETSDGRPFFYLADTTWEPFHRLTLAQADHYLSNHAAKGFTVIQAVVLAELDGLNTANADPAAHVSGQPVRRDRT